MFAALTPRAALLPESWETEFSILGTLVLIVLICVIPVTVMVRDYRKGGTDPGSEPAQDTPAAGRKA